MARRSASKAVVSSILVAVILLGFASSSPAAGAEADASASAEAIQQVNLPNANYPYPDGGVQIGQGWDSFNEQGTPGSCVEVDAVLLEQSSYKSEVEQITSTYSLIKKMTTSVSAAYRGGGVRASGSFSTAKESQINSDYQNFRFTFESATGSTFAVPPATSNAGQFELSESTLKLLQGSTAPGAQENLLAALTNRPTQFKGGLVELTEEAKNLLKENNRTDFRKVCGDGFVAAIHRGAVIRVLLTQRYQSRDSKERLSASLRASGWGASGSASYSKSSAEFNATGELGYRIFQEGGLPIAPKAIQPVPEGKFFDINWILPNADHLLANPTAFRVTIVPYESVIGGVGNLQSPAGLFRAGDYYIALNDLYTLVGEILSAELVGVSSAEGAALDPRIIDAYGGFYHLRTLLDLIHRDLAFLEGLIARCYDTRSACTLASALESAKKDITLSVTEANVRLTEISKKLKELKLSYKNLTSALKDLDKSKIQIEEDIKDLTNVSKMLSDFVDHSKEYANFITETNELRSDFYLRFFAFLV